MHIYFAVEDHEDYHHLVTSLRYRAEFLYNAVNFES